MKRTALSLVLLFSAYSQGAQISELTYCDAITFRTGLLAQAVFDDPSYNAACESWKKRRFRTPLPLAVQLDGQANTAPEFIYIDRKRTQAPGPIFDFVVADRRTKTVRFDWARFGLAINDWPVYHRRIETMRAAGGEVTPNVDLKHHIGSEGAYVACTITYSDQQGAPRWRELNLSFYKEGKVSASYASPLISLDNSQGLARLEIMRELFSSMRSGAPK